jgi:hypothetical protein
MRRRRKAGADWADDFALRGGRTADFLRLYIIGQYLLYQYLFYYYLFVCDFPTSDFPTTDFPTPDFQTVEAGGFFALRLRMTGVSWIDCNKTAGVVLSEIEVKAAGD